MHLLLSNDDGHQSPGLSLLARALSAYAKITVVVPDRDRSGCSNALTLGTPLQINQNEEGFFYLNGTPADCIHVALTGLLDEMPDMVIAGINTGANLGEDVLYSGTVAAATEGRFLPYPAVALSLVNKSARQSDYQNTIEIFLPLFEQLIAAEPSANNMLFNINIPSVSPEQLNGYQVTRLGNRHQSGPVCKETDSSGQTVYWIGKVGVPRNVAKGTDFYAINNNYVSITPLQFDMTAYDMMEQAEILLGEKHVGV